MSFILDSYAWYFLVLIVFEVYLLNQKQKYVLERTPPNTPLNEDLGYDYRTSVLFAILLFLPLIIAAGMRYDRYIGDTYLYVELFKRYPSSIFDLGGYLTWEEKDFGFIIFSTFLKQFIGNDYDAWLMIISIISLSCIALTYRKYTSEIVLCAFLFFASTDYMSWMMNGMRQFLVAAILFAAFPLLQKKKTFLFVLIVLLLYTFHSSCLIVIPLYIAAMGKPLNGKTMTILGGMMMCVLFLDLFTDVLGQALTSTDYGTVVNQFNEDDGTNVLRVLVYAVPSVLAVIFRNKIPEDTPDIINISINMSMISTGFYIVSMFTSGIYIGRIPIYFSLFNYILLPWELRTFFSKDLKTIVNGCMIIGYLLLFIFQMNFNFS